MPEVPNTSMLAALAYDVDRCSDCLRSEMCSPKIERIEDNCSKTQSATALREPRQNTICLDVLQKQNKGIYNCPADFEEEISETLDDFA